MKYNPAFLDDDTLKGSFVARHVEMELMLETIRENTGEANQHLLVIGPRGIGKTTLVLRVAAEIRAEEDLRARWYPLVYGEESYHVTSPGEFWLEALFHLGGQSGEASRWKSAYEELRAEQDEQRLRERALVQLMDFADEQDRRLLLIVENLNMIVGMQMKSDDAWVLRHTLTNEPRIMLLGTATSRFKEIEEYDQALYDLFKIIELEPLDEGESRALWQSIAGKAPPLEQMRPIQILTGGNPRLIRIISEFAADASFRELMTNLIQLVDEHTEYFKHHLDSLAPQERKVFVALADLWDPSTARDVADAARLDVNVTSALLKRLVERGAATVDKQRGRTKYYQVAERMYNIYHLMRRRGQASSRVRAVVRFMIHLYSGDDLARMITSEACALPADERRMHFLAYETILTMLPEPALKAHIVAETAHRFDTMPDTPPSVLQLIRSLQAERPGVQTLKERLTEEQKLALLTLSVDDVDDADTLLKLGNVLSEQPDRHKEAEAAYRKALDLDPKNTSAWIAFGVFLGIRLHRHVEALDAVNRAPDIDPDNADAWRNTGAALIFLGRLEDALDAVNRALDIDPDNADAWHNKGAALALLGRLEEALDAFSRALDLDNADAWYWYNKGQVLISLGRHEEALDAYNRALALDPDNADAWYNKGTTLIRLGRHEEALDAFNNSLDVVPNHVSSWANKGAALFRLGRLEEALDAFSRALDIVPDNALAWRNKGIVLNNLERHEEALNAFRRALEIAPAHLSALHSLARTLYLLGDEKRLPEAEAFARRAVEQEPKTGTYQHTLATILGAQGKWPEALEHTAIFLQDADMVANALSDVIDFFVEAAAAGYATEALQLIEISPSAEALEPMSVALHLYQGDEIDVALEIREVAQDVVKRIEARRAAKQEA